MNFLFSATDLALGILGNCGVGMIEEEEGEGERRLALRKAPETGEGTMRAGLRTTNVSQWMRLVKFGKDCERLAESKGAVSGSYVQILVYRPVVAEIGTAVASGVESQKTTPCLSPKNEPLQHREELTFLLATSRMPNTAWTA